MSTKLRWARSQIFVSVFSRWRHQTCNRPSKPRTSFRGPKKRRRGMGPLGPQKGEYIGNISENIQHFCTDFGAKMHRYLFRNEHIFKAILVLRVRLAAGDFFSPKTIFLRVRLAAGAFFCWKMRFLRGFCVWGLPQAPFFVPKCGFCVWALSQAPFCSWKIRFLALAPST